MKKFLTGAILALLAPIAVAENAVAEDADAATRAEAIIQQMEDLYRGESSKAELTMRIETPQYQRTLELSSKNLGEDSAFIRIESPRKDRGITTLRLGEEMWNYFPKINKVIKVPPSMMMGSWMGSDFTNDDLVQQTDLTEEYSLFLEETEDRYEIALEPRGDTVTVWGRIEYDIDRESLIPIEQRFFDDDGTLVRRLSFRELKSFSGRILPSVLEMVPLNKEDHRTVVTYDELVFEPDDVSPDDFTLRALKRRF